MDFLTDLLDSSAGIAAAIGLLAALLALVARWADARRMQRCNPDAVGFMPWTAIYFTAILVACIEIGLAARTMFAG